MFNSNNSDNCNIPFFFHELKDAVKKKNHATQLLDQMKFTIKFETTS